eukprot:COSAG06_NODE_18068_length_905_cov_1.208437_1_plen_164_part_10
METALGGAPLILALPEELRLRVLSCCPPRALLRLEATCVALRDCCERGGEQLWRQLLLEVWLRNPRCSQYGARRWWLCRAVSVQPRGRFIDIALPWRVCGHRPFCQLLKQLSFRESYKACLLERERLRLTDEELMTLKWSVDFSGMATYLPLADNLRATNPIAL